jgi:hypothetical protein
MASANQLYLDLNGLPGGNISPFVGSDGITGTFAEFGLTGTFATSIYDFSDSSPVGRFIDTNDPAILAANGVPGTFPAASGGGDTVSLRDPIANAEINFDAFTPLDPGTGDIEGFNAPDGLGGGGILIEYTFEGFIGGGQPNYDGGSFTASLYDAGGPDDGLTLFTGTVTGSDFATANLDIFFEIQEALPDFLFVDTGSGFVDAADFDVETVGTGNAITLRLDTNVDPPVPTLNQLALVNSGQFAADPDGNGPLVVGIRQASLDSSLRPGVVPAPAPLLLLGLGLAALGLRSKAKK